MEKTLRRPAPMRLLTITLISLGLSIFFAHRYRDLSDTIDANKSAMAANLRPRADSPTDASSRVANSVANDEALFDATLNAVAAKKTAGLLSLLALGFSVAAVVLLGRGDRKDSTR